ncbi:hypothetical protein ACH41H_25505 [Streptomyces sp. NPDC020800]|uniref:hypothetical protein n=1 Tax=Streptomyces sp. NPDC020800 TaxID=3365092 RepID=UPI0037930A86
MGWENIRERLRAADLTWSFRDHGAAAAMSVAQLPAVSVLLWINDLADDDYGSGYNPLAALVFLIIGAVLAVVVALSQPLGLSLPAVLLARFGRRRLGGRTWAWHLATPVAPAVAWGILGALAGAGPFAFTVPLLTALGVLPSLWVARVRRRTWRQWGVWGRAALISPVLVVLALGGGLTALAVGLIQQYEPPRLTTAQLAGVWKGASGAELRLRPDGHADAVRLPLTDRKSGPGFTDYTMCGGPGTWEPDGTGRDGILVRFDCGRATHWAFAGSEHAPELFARYGDEDGGTVWILQRSG